MAIKISQELVRTEGEKERETGGERDGKGERERESERQGSNHCVASLR